MLCSDQLIDTLAVVVLRPQSSLEVSEQDTADARNLVAFMSQHYNHIFKVRRREQRGARQEPPYHILPNIYIPTNFHGFISFGF